MCGHYYVAPSSAVNYVQFLVHHLFSVVSCHPNLIATLSVARAVDYTALLEHRMNRLVIIKINQTIQYKITKILSSKLYHTADTICSHFDRIHIWFVTNIKQEQTICTTLDLIWRKQQVGQKLAFYFRPKLAVCSKPSQMCVILKRCSCLVKHALMPHSN